MATKPQKSTKSKKKLGADHVLLEADLMAPLLVMSLQDNWFGNPKLPCIYAAIRLRGPLVQSMRSLSSLSHDMGGKEYTEGTELFVGHWPVMWDGAILSGIGQTVWHVLGNRQWAECFSRTGALLGRTIDFDVRELALIVEDAVEYEPVVWHHNDLESDYELEELFGATFEELALDRLKKARLIDTDLVMPESTWSDRQEELGNMDWQAQFQA